MNFDEILAKYRAQALSKVDMGDRFERLMVCFMKTYQIYDSRFLNVWQWRDFPFRKSISPTDTGIDIVAQTAENEFWAVQAKFYREDRRVDKGDIDSFINLSGRSFQLMSGDWERFDLRLLISTTDNRSEEFDRSTVNQFPPFAQISLTELREASVDWKLLDGGVYGREARTATKSLREHQIKAVAEFEKHFRTNERGTMALACGTGKTFTALKIAENLTKGRGLVLFLAPSIALINQTFKAWCDDTAYPIHGICVCSDPKVIDSYGKGRVREDRDDDEELRPEILPVHAKTDKTKLAEALGNAIGVYGQKMSVVFSTYQSARVVSDAAREKGVEFDLMVCDEAHRTTGLEGAEVEGAERDDRYSGFTAIHSQDFIKAKRRLYMTATPKVYVGESLSKAKAVGRTVYSMDNVDHYGIEVYHMGFGEAVRKGLLSDYKVLVLTLPKGTEPEELKAVVSKVMMEDPGKGKKKLNVDDALRFLGCIFALSKRMDSESKILLEIDPGRMHKAVAFCDSIKKSRGVSKVFTEFEATYRDRLHDDIKGALLRVESRHVDGGMGFSERENEMNWLKDGGNDADECRILSNVYCLSEGLDLPSLDAVIFLSEKNSPVQIIQSVGRVMRLAKGKKFGYIIIPVLIPQGVNPVTALDDTKLFSTVLAVLRGLKSHDDTFVSEINRLRLNDEKTSEKLIVCGKPKDHAEEDVDMSDSGGRSQLGEMIHAISDMDAYRPALYAKLVDKLGSDSDIDIWADDVGKLAKRYIARIGESVGKEGEAKRRFDAFVKDLQININPSVDRDEAIRMLAQHTASMPVFESLFEGHSFAAQNPVSKSMQGVLDVVAPDIAKSEFSAIKSEWVTEDNKVNLARMFASGIDNAVSRQRLIVELYDKFFRKAFPDVVERLGIVYTPIEVVDFIIHSVAGVLDREFGRKISDEGVHILDPFTGTGTFITRLIQSDLLGDSLERKYHKELHVSEMVLLAYYISSINIQNAYHGEMGEGTPYTPFGGICLNDTFQLYEYTHDPKNDHEWSGLGDGFGEILRENSARVDEQSKTPIMVILGNPPYSVGQRAANDNAQNLEYSYLDGRIKEKYSTNSAASSQKALYDSYIRAFRWGTERLLENGGRPGIIAFVTNAGWLDGNGMDGMRKCLAEDFSSIYVFNLRGNQRTSGELSRKEGGKIFGSGSRTPVAVTVLVRNPAKIGTAEIFYSDIGDYLSRSAKLWIIETLHDIYNPDMGWRKIVPNASGDWINQRTGTFADFIQIGDKGDKANCNTFFVPCYSLGIASGKDTWCYNSSENILKFNIRNTISFYNEQREEFHQNLSGEDQNSKVRDIVDNDSTKISWTRALLADLAKDKLITFRASNVVASSYRPFFKQHLYFDRSLNEMVYQIPRLFPTPDNPNQVICVSGIGVTKEFSVIITDIIPDLELIGKSQCFPLYWYEKEGYENSNLFSSGKRTEKVINGYVRHDGITDWILGEFKQKFGKELPRFSKTQIFHYVYGILHSPRYREAFSVDLKKSLPRIPLVTEAQDFLAFSEAGKALAKLHLGYETVKPYPAKVSGADTGRFQVEKMRFGKRPDGKPDRTVIQYSDLIRVEDIPLEAYEYVVNGKSTIDWIIERYQVKTDKDSAIINDPNDWAKEHGEPRYILDLLLRVITVSLETIRIVKGLPRLDFS